MTRLRNVLVGLVVLAAIAAGWFGWSWWSAAHDDGLAVATTREQVLRQARDALVTLNTVDYRTAKQDIGQWIRVTTGRFGSELADRKTQQLAQVKQNKTVASAKVASIAVTELHPRKGAARVMAVLDIEVRGRGEREQRRHSMLEVRLTRTEQVWKVKHVQAAR